MSKPRRDGWRRTKEPGIWQLPSGAYIVRWYDHDGKRHSESAPDYDAARKLRSEHTDRTWRVRKGYEKPGADMTLAQVVPLWLAKRAGDRAAGKRKYRPGDDESKLNNHVLPFLGAYTLREITIDVVGDFIRHLGAKRTARHGEHNKDGRTLRPSTIRNCIILVRKLLADHGYHVRVEYTVPDSGFGWIESPEDVGRFLAACEPDWFRMACALSVYAGLRLGEVAGLRRDALDFERELIHVTRSYDGPTKSNHVRNAPLPPDLASMLRPWLLSHSGGLVVTRPDPNAPEHAIPIATYTMDDATGKDFAKRARRACKRAGVEPVTFQQLRHTFASHVADKAPEGYVGAMLGHADLRTTRRYTHRNTEAIARDPRVKLSFAAPKNEVVPFPGRSDGQRLGNARQSRTHSPTEKRRNPAVS